MTLLQMHRPRHVWKMIHSWCENTVGSTFFFISLFIPHEDSWEELEMWLVRFEWKNAPRAFGLRWIYVLKKFSGSDLESQNELCSIFHNWFP